LKHWNVIAASLLAACSQMELVEQEHGAPDEGFDSGTDTESETEIDAFFEPCSPDGDGIEFHLYSLGGFEIVEGRGYQLEDGVLSVDDWGAFLCSADLDPEQIGALLAAALQIDFPGLEQSYPGAVDGMYYDLTLELPPCVYETRWGILEEIETAPPEVHDFAHVVESIGDPLAESCPNASP
jgi:hypothetical protein